MTTDHTLGAVREFLRFAVPLASIDLTHRYTQKELALFLPGIAVRGGLQLGHGGDVFQFSKSDRKIIRRTASELATGIAAAAMLAGPDGITVLGVHFCSAVRCTHTTEPAAAA
ncbi:hypothetical protein [Streptomyces poriferorum]|uniref:Uncharacterized protein n=1 Tax=Streptomyces poriferorum TaxID=2798799 RepID=A0ABY9IZK9_9ACTN|nr:MULTISPECIES: hypothetical protein [unclassified Streptomyces]MDP5310446.1 hypothetical protein [Streptomyces sp. Alt4]WLQ60400.1 hypothetical protein P8A19_35475 [Streptomyces sp. Alt2]